MLSRKSTILLTFICILPILLNSCANRGDARKYPPDPKLRVKRISRKVEDLDYQMHWAKRVGVILNLQAQMSCGGHL